MKMIKTGLLCAAMFALATPASAQLTWTDRGFVNVNFGAQTGSRELTLATTFEIYNEQGSVTSTQDVKAGTFFDLSGGVKVWRNLALGAGFMRSVGNADAAVTASVPDPLVFDTPRTVTASATDLKHTEQAVNVSATWMIPFTDKVDIGLVFGPTFFSVKQEFPTSVTVTEPGPALSSVDIAEVDESTVGVHFGVDVSYMFTPRFGVGGLARFTRGSIEIPNAAEKLTVGGFQIGAGGRVRF